MKIVIPGGSGHVGTLVAHACHRQGHQVVVLSRRPQQQPWRVMFWDGHESGGLVNEVDGADVVINLAGRSVNCRYSPANRRQILDSRVLSTEVVAQAIAAAHRPPRVWLQASTATIYAHRYDAANDEISGIIGGGEPGAPPSWNFSIDVARAWEHALERAVLPRTRKVVMRAAVIMSPEQGGIFDTLLGLVRCGLGGSAGHGRQFVSWIHADDFLRAISWLVEDESLEGPVNIASPNPLPNAEFMRALREAWGIPIGLPAAGWMLELGSLFLRTETELILKSRRVVPRRLLERGLVFRYPEWPVAARDLCQQWKALRYHRPGASMPHPQRQ